MVTEIRYSFGMVEPESINRLVVISQHCQCASPRPHQIDKFLFRHSKVLVFIYHDIVKYTRGDVSTLEAGDAEVYDFPNEHSAVPL